MGHDLTPRTRSKLTVAGHVEGVRGCLPSSVNSLNPQVWGCSQSPAATSLPEPCCQGTAAGMPSEPPSCTAL